MKQIPADCENSLLTSRSWSDDLRCPVVITVYSYYKKSKLLIKGNKKLTSYLILETTSHKRSFYGLHAEYLCLPSNRRQTAYIDKILYARCVS